MPDFLPDSGEYRGPRTRESWEAPNTRNSAWEEESPPPTEIDTESMAGASEYPHEQMGVPRTRTFPPRRLAGSFSAPTSPMARPMRSPSALDWAATPRTAIADAVRARINPGRAMSEAGSIVAEGMDAAATAAAELIKVPLAVAGVGVACV